VVVDDLYARRALIGLDKADTPSVANADAVLPDAFLFWRLHAVPRCRFKEVQRGRAVEHRQLTLGGRSKFRETGDTFALV
jgi:hypothetical protein